MDDKDLFKEVKESKRKVLSRIAIMFIVSVMVVIILTVVKSNQINKEESIRQLSLALKIKQDRENKIIELIKKYILDNSDRISNKMANEIAQVIAKKKIPIILLAVIKIESTFNPTSLSSTGALGLGQIMPVHVKKLITLKYIDSQRDLFDIEANINSTEYLWLLMWNGNKGDIIKTLTNYYGANDSVYQNKFFKEYFKVKYLLQDYLNCDHIEYAIEGK